MRTTLTLDDDLDHRLRELAHRRQTSVREELNLALRRGLAMQAPERFEVKTFRSAFRPGVDPQRLNQLLDDLAVEDTLAGSRA